MGNPIQLSATCNMANLDNAIIVKPPDTLEIDVLPPSNTLNVQKLTILKSAQAIHNAVQTAMVSTKQKAENVKFEWPIKKEQTKQRAR